MRVAALLAVVVSGCGLTLDEPCQTNADCEVGEICNAGGMCVTPGDGGGGFDGGATDAGAPLDGPPPIDASWLDAPGCTPVDADGDGYSECEGDCDDTNPWVYLGAPEVCGDGVDNGCTGGAADAICGGLGTFVAAPPAGDDANPGTMAMPVATIAEGIAHAVTIGMGVDVYVAEGRYPEDVQVTEDVSLFGGFEAATWSRDAISHPTHIDSTTNAGLSFPAGITRVTEVSGFVIHGLAGTAGNSSAITIVPDSSPTVTDNVIEGPPSGGASTAIKINPAGSRGAGGNPLIARNEIRMGTSRDNWGSTNGSRGVHVQRMQVEIHDNRIFLADDAGSYQVGLDVFATPAGTRVSKNVVRGTGMAWHGRALTLGAANADVVQNDLSPGRCVHSCDAVIVGGAGFTANLVNNVILGGQGESASGIWYGNEGGVPSPVPELLVHSNFIRGGDATTFAAAISIGECEPGALSIGVFQNNILYSGTASSGYRTAFVEAHPNVDPATFENNALWLESSGSGTTAVLYIDEGIPSRCHASPIRGLLDAAMINGTVIATARANIFDDCDVVDVRVDGDFHIAPGSACIDAGTTANVPPDDIDGDARPAGTAPDIGVDEAG